MRLSLAVGKVVVRILAEFQLAAFANLSSSMENYTRALQLYRQTSISVALEDSLSELVESREITEELKSLVLEKVRESTTYELHRRFNLSMSSFPMLTQL